MWTIMVATSVPKRLLGTEHPLSPEGNCLSFYLFLTLAPGHGTYPNAALWA